MDGGKSIWNERGAMQHETAVDEEREWSNGTNLSKGCSIESFAYEKAFEREGYHNDIKQGEISSSPRNLIHGGDSIEALMDSQGRTAATCR